MSIILELIMVCECRPLPYPNALAQDLLEQCLATPELRNEVYCQIIKQLTENPSPQSAQKGWQLMKCCLQTFPPSEEFANYLEMFLAANGKGDKYIEVRLLVKLGLMKTGSHILL